MIINLTQHTATPEQAAAGVLEPANDSKAAIRELLTFDDLPARGEIESRAHDLAILSWQCAIAGISDDDANAGAEPQITHALIGGAPFFMAALESALLDQGITPVYAFSRRESVEETQPDGSVVKRNIFKHIGFVEVEKGNELLVKEACEVGLEL